MSDMPVWWKLGTSAFLVGTFLLLLAAVLDGTGFGKQANYAGFSGLGVWGLGVLSMVACIWFGKD